MIDSPWAVTVINSDEFAIAGTTDSADFMQSLPTSTPSGRNGFVLHLRGLGANPPQFEVANELVFGGAGDDAAIDIIRGPRSPIFGGTEMGQVVIGGYTDSADFMFGSPQGGTDAFVGIYTPGKEYLIGVRYGGSGDDRFGRFGNRSLLGIPQPSIADYDGDDDLDFFTTTRISKNSANEFLQIREWNAYSFEVWRERHIFGLFGGSDTFSGFSAAARLLELKCAGTTRTTDSS